LGKIFTGTVNIKIQHRHGRLIRRSFAPFAVLRGTFQGERDLVRVT